MWDFSLVCVLMPYWFLRLVIFAARSPVDDRILTHISTNHRATSKYALASSVVLSDYFSNAGRIILVYRYADSRFLSIP
jgi:hypothetical protein